MMNCFYIYEKAHDFSLLIVKCRNHSQGKLGVYMSEDSDTKLYAFIWFKFLIDLPFSAKIILYSISTILR
jgi:hypothetical protein